MTRTASLPRSAARTFASLATAALLTVTLGACGDDKSDVKVTEKERTTLTPKSPEPTETTETDPPTTTSTDSPEPEPEPSTSGDTPLAELVAGAQSAVDSQLAQYPDTYSAMSVEADEPDTIIYSYTYKNVMDASATASTMDKQAGTLQSTLDSQVFPAMKQAGIASPKATYIYKNSDGSVIWERTFSPS